VSLPCTIAVHKNSNSLSYHRGTLQRYVSIEILSAAAHLHTNILIRKDLKVTEGHGNCSIPQVKYHFLLLVCIAATLL